MPTISECASAGVQDMHDADKAQYRGATRLVTEDQVGDALRWLASNAAEIGAARARIVKAGHMVKHVESLLFLASAEKTVDAKKADVKTSQMWIDATNEEAEAAGEFEKMKALREAAMARLDCWRTESASNRASVR